MRPPAASTPPPDGELLRLTIESVAYGGKGVARLDGKVWFVENAVEGDVVLARSRPDAPAGQRYGEADVVRLETASPLRGPSPCPHSDVCGGCQWLGIDYARQLEWKRGFVTAALRRIGKLGDTPVEIVPAPSTLAYRNRILVRLHHRRSDDAPTPRLGYFRRGTHDLSPIDACAIAAAPLNQILAAIGRLDLSELPDFKARLELQAIPADGPPDATGVVVTIYPADGPHAASGALAERVRALPGVAWCGLVFDLEKAPLLDFDTDLDRRFLTRPALFQQVNVAMNRLVRRAVRDHAVALGARRILDVHCGSGNLSLPLADGERYVEGVEMSRPAILVAREAAQRGGIANTNYLAGDAARHLWKCARGGEKFDLVVLDPPRQGMRDAMPALKSLAPPAVVYVSCDPTTLARDLGYMCRGDEYRLTSVVAYDFFPNTYHVETVAVVVRG